MEGLLYRIIVVYFMLGAVAFAFIGRGKSRDQKKEIWLKWEHLLRVVFSSDPGLFDRGRWLCGTH